MTVLTPGWGQCHIPQNSTDTKILDFKLSPCSEYCILSYGWFPGVWILLNSCSRDLRIWNSLFQNIDTFTPPMKMEQVVPNRRHVHITYEDGTGCSKTSARSHHLRRWNRMFQNVGTFYTTFEDGTGCSRTSVHKIQTPGNRPKERLQQTRSWREKFLGKKWLQIKEGIALRDLRVAPKLQMWIVLLCVLCVCKCVLYYCHRVSTQLQLTYTGLFISPSGISELDCATTKTDTAERSISICRESPSFFFCTRGLGVLPGSTARG